MPPGRQGSPYSGSSVTRASMQAVYVVYVVHVLFVPQRFTTGQATPAAEHHSRRGTHRMESWTRGGSNASGRPGMLRSADSPGSPNDHKARENRVPRRRVRTATGEEAPACHEIPKFMSPES